MKSTLLPTVALCLVGAGAHAQSGPSPFPRLFPPAGPAAGGPAAPPQVPAANLAQPSPQSARVVEQRIRSAIAGFFGPALPLPDRLVEVAPAGDHYTMAVPLGAGPAAPRITASASVSKDGIWALQDIRLPSLNRSNAGGAPARVSIAQQTGEAHYDPSQIGLDYDQTLAGAYLYTAQGGHLELLHAERLDSHTASGPTAQGRLDITHDLTVVAPRWVEQALLARGRAEIGAGGLRLSLRLGEVRGASVQTFVQRLLPLLDRPRPSDAQLGGMTALLDDLLSSAALDLAADDVAAVIPDRGDLSLHKASASAEIAAQDGVLNGQLSLGAEGLFNTELLTHDLIEAIPAKMALRVSVGGISQAATKRLLETAIGLGSADDARTALIGNGVSVSIDDVSVSRLDTRITGAGKVTLKANGTVEGAGQVTAENFEAWERALSPVLPTRDARAAVVFVKGLARPSGNTLVWDIAYKADRLLVNGQDVFAMLR